MEEKPKKHLSPWIAWSIVLLVAGSAGFAIWFYWNQIDTVSGNISITFIKKTENADKVASETADWKTYTDVMRSFSFKYPKDWYAQEQTNNNLVSLRNDNTGIEYNKSNIPAVYEDLFIGYSDNSCSVARENSDNASSQDKSTVTKSVIDNSNITINAYQYVTNDGQYISAYWQNTAGKRFCAYSNMLPTNKTDNENVFKKLLSTFQFTPVK